MKLNKMNRVLRIEVGALFVLLVKALLVFSFVFDVLAVHLSSSKKMLHHNLYTKVVQFLQT